MILKRKMDSTKTIFDEDGFADEFPEEDEEEVEEFDAEWNEFRKMNRGRRRFRGRG